MKLQRCSNEKWVGTDRHAVTVSWIGQAGFLFKLCDDRILCIDPYYSNSIERYEGRDCRRMWYNSFIVENFACDYVLCSHDHLDHTDPETLPLLYAYTSAKFYGPPSSVEHMRNMRFSQERINTLKADEELRLNGCSIIPKRTFHTEDSLGFILHIDKYSDSRKSVIISKEPHVSEFAADSRNEADKDVDIQQKNEHVTIYFTGDTSLDESLNFLEKENISILIACVNGKYGNLSLEDAAELYHRTSASLLIPMHFGLIQNNTVSKEEIMRVFHNSGVNYQILETEKPYCLF